MCLKLANIALHVLRKKIRILYKFWMAGASLPKFCLSEICSLCYLNFDAQLGCIIIETMEVKQVYQHPYPYDDSQFVKVAYPRVIAY